MISGKFILAIVNTKMLLVSRIIEALLALEPIGQDDTVLGHLIQHDPLQCSFGAVRHNSGAYPDITFDEAKYHGLAISVSAAIA